MYANHGELRSTFLDNDPAFFKAMCSTFLCSSPYKLDLQINLDMNSDPGQGSDQDPGSDADQDPGQGSDQDPGLGVDQDPGSDADQDPDFDPNGFEFGRTRSFLMIQYYI